MKSEDSNQDSEIHFVGGANTTPWLHFEMPDFRRIMLLGKINDAPAQFLLDSGVGALVLDHDFAAALRLHTIDSVTGVGVTGHVNAQAAEGVHISFGDLSINAPRVTLLDMKGFAGALNAPVVALLGRDVFDSLIVDIDFEKQKLAFRDPTTKQALPGGTELPLTRGPLGRRRLPVSIEGRRTIQASFDLGADRALVLSPDYVSEQKLLLGKRTSTALGVSVAGAAVSEVAVVDELALGQTIFHRVPVEVPKTWALDCPAVVGFPVLSRLRMIIDFPHDRVAMLSNRGVIDQPFSKDRSGIGAKRLSNKLEIMHVAPGSPAEAAGLRVGDVVIAINGEKLSPEFFKNHPRDGSKAAGTIMYFTLLNGSKVKLTLADYF
jgi:Aspartyl protease/PDZ domain